MFQQSRFAIYIAWIDSKRWKWPSVLQRALSVSSPGGRRRTFHKKTASDEEMLGVGTIFVQENWAKCLQYTRMRGKMWVWVGRSCQETSLSQPSSGKKSISSGRSPVRDCLRGQAWPQWKEEVWSSNWVSHAVASRPILSPNCSMNNP